jgi:ribosomal-protein-serine acetyltransferase
VKPERYLSERRVDDDITLHVLESYHAEDLFALVNANRDYLHQWLAWVDESISPRATAAYIAAARQQQAAQQGYQMGIWYRGRIAGTIGMHAIDWTNKITEIGYWLGAALQGRGIMTRACHAMTTAAFEDLHLNRVQIRCAVGNQRSSAVPRRLGYQYEGTLRQSQWLHDHYVDLEIYGMLAAEWPRPLCRS